MDNLMVKTSSNWSQIGGCTFDEMVQVQNADPDLFVRPPIDEIVNEEKAVLLSKEQSSEYCELYMEIFPHYKIQAVSFACNVPKVEIFQGPIKEYLETVYGVIVDDSDDQFKSYRYDVEIEKSGITNLTLRFLTDSNDVCIFGIMLHTAPNPNGITTLLPNASCINIQNVENILQNPSKQSDPNFEKYKNMMELMTKSKQSSSLPLEQLLKEKINIFNDKNCSCSRTADENLLNQLKIHIDKRFHEMEMHINKNFEAIEQRQMQKLDNIISILKTNK